MNKLTALLIAVISVSVSACGINRKEVNVETDAELSLISPIQADKVAMNLVYTLTQLQSLHPLQTTVQLNNVNTSLGESIKSRLGDAGYGTQMVTTDVGNHFVRYKYENSISNEGALVKASVSIGFISAEREYRLYEGRIVPDSPIVVIGDDVEGVVTNDEIFGPFDASEKYADMTIGTVSEMPEIVVMASAIDSAPSNNFAESIRRNLARTGDTMEQNIDGYETAAESVLIFEDEKIYMGKANKNVVRELAKSYNPETDVITLVGCSQGATRVPGGNEALAMGRANRVKEELLFANVPSGQIFEEGCWTAHDSPDNELPRRGVVVRLKRKNT